MTEQFVPIQQTSVMPPAQPQLSPEMQATIQHAKTIGSEKFQQMFRAVALWEQAVGQIKKIETEEEHQNIIKLFDNVKRALNAAEEFRKDTIFVPWRFTKLVNDTFRPLKQRLEGVKQHFGLLLAEKQREIEKAHQQQLDEAKKAQEAQGPAVEIPTGDGEGRVQLTPVADVANAPPPSTVKVDSGEKASFRERVVMTIEDPIALLKAIVSTGSRNEIYTLELVEFKEPAIKKLCSGRRKIPGVKWKMEKFTV